MAETNYISTITVDSKTYDVKDEDAVLFSSQSLTDAQKAQARTNIGAGTSSFSGNYDDLANKPDIPDSTSIPSKTSDLTNDSNYAVDASYVHTDNNYTTTDKNKLAGIAASATANTVLTLSGTLGTSWTGSAAPYTQSVSVSGILASDTPVLDIICSTSNFEAEQEAWGKVFKAVCSANTITFYASEATEVSVSFNAKVVR